MSSTVDARAIVTGTAVGLAFVVPATVLARVATHTDGTRGTGWGVALALILLGGAAAGGVAGRRVADTPMLHGALAGLATFIVAQVGFTFARRTVPNPIGVVLYGGLFMSLGAVGAALAGRRTGKGRSTPPREERP